MFLITTQRRRAQQPIAYHSAEAAELGEHVSCPPYVLVSRHPWSWSVLLSKLTAVASERHPTARTRRKAVDDQRGKVLCECNFA